MADQRKILAERLQTRIDATGISMRAASVAIGANASYVRQLLIGKGGMPSADKLLALAHTFATTTHYLLGEVETPAQPQSEVGIYALDETWRDKPAQKLAVYGTGYCDDLQIETNGHVWHVEQTMFEPTHVIQMIERPAALRDSKDAYAIYFHGSSMEPRFFQGEIAIVVPNPPPGPGDFVVVQLNDGNDDHVVHVLVKRLVRATSTYVELEQYNPAITFRIDRKRVSRMHMILSPNAILAK